MERHDNRAVTNFQERQEVDSDVPEIDVEHVRFVPVQRGKNAPRLGSVNGDGESPNLLLPDTPEGVGARLGNYKERIKRKLGHVFLFLSENYRSHRAQRLELAVDVQHFLFQKGRQVGGYDGLSSAVERGSGRLRKIHGALGSGETGSMRGGEDLSRTGQIGLELGRFRPERLEALSSS